MLEEIPSDHIQLGSPIVQRTNRFFLSINVRALRVRKFVCNTTVTSVKLLCQLL
jgi:hypothetical protein